MEEHRGWLADRLALSLVNRRQVGVNDFRVEPTGGVFLEEDARKRVIKAYQERKQEEIVHPFLGGEDADRPIALCPSPAAREARPGDIDGYPPFLWR